MNIHNWSEDAKRQWDGFAEKWSKHSCEIWETGSRKIILPFFSKYVPTGSKVVDLGCGDGYSTIKLGQMGYLAKGLDLSNEMIQAAKDKTAESLGVEFIQGDLADTPFTKEEFDAAIAITSLEWTEKPLEVLQEINRIVKPGGFGCFGILGPTAAPRKEHSYPRIQGKDVIMNRMQAWDLERLAIENGWELIAELGIPKRGVNYEQLGYLAKDLQQSLSFIWLFVFKKK